MTVTINRYQPTALENKIYTVTRAAKLLGIKSNQVEFIYPMNGGCLVGLFNDSVFIKKVDFVKLVSGDRQNRSKGLTVTQNAFNPSVFTVRNEGKNTLYSLETHKNHISCSCPDHQNLVEDFGTQKVACKHVYALLNHLGLTDLREYIKLNEGEENYKAMEDYQHLGYANY